MSLRALASGPRPRVVCLGLSAFDIVWSVEALPHGGGKVRARDVRTGGGGMAATAAVAAARLGAEASFWGRGGDDHEGRSARRELADCGVDVAGFHLFEGARSSVSGVVVDAHGERAIVNFRGEGLPTSADWLPLAEIASADAVLADPRWPEGAAALFAAARSAGVPSVLDGDIADAATFDALLPAVDYAIFSEPGLRGYAEATRGVRTGGEAVDDSAVYAGAEARLLLARQQGARLAAVTLGAHGVVWSDADGTHRLPAYAVQAVDTTGAGDVFHGAFAFALGALGPSAPMRDVFGFASVVAALKCERAGARAGIPDLATAVAALHAWKETA